MTSSTLHIPYCVTAMRILGKSYCLHFNSLCFSVDTTVEIRYILPRLTLSLCLSIYRQQLGGFIYHSTSLPTLINTRGVSAAWGRLYTARADAVQGLFLSLFSFICRICCGYDVMVGGGREFLLLFFISSFSFIFAQ